MNVKNIIIKNSNKVPPPMSRNLITTFAILWILLYLVIGFLISYLTVMTIKYLTTDCLEKKNWFDYIFGFCYNEVCKKPKMNIIGSLNLKDTIPKDALPDFKQPVSPDKIPKDNIPISNIAAKVLGNSKNPSVEFAPHKLIEKPQVFHIGNQDYTYNQAKCKCASYNARLATYSQIVEAYNKGADWCSYGWTEGQNAYYPTQKCNWLKKSPEERKACGKPGINGGFFGDPNLKFGVNCYGKKPKGSIVKMEDKTCDYCEVQPNYNASHQLDTDEILPFNKDKWSA